MSVSEEARINKRLGSMPPLEFWGCTNSLRYHSDRLHIYRNCPKIMEPDIVERENGSIKEYDQLTSMIGGSRGSRDSQGIWVHTYSTKAGFMF